MSELRPPLSPREVRRKAFALAKKCWLTVLIAVVAMGLFDFAEISVNEFFARRGAETYQACFDEFYAARGETAPADPDEAKDYEFLLFSTEFRAWQEYERITEEGKFICALLELLGLMWKALIAVRLCRGLLDALQGDICTPHHLLSGWARIPTTCWMAFQRALRISGWTALAGLIFLGFGMFFDDWGLLIGCVPVCAVYIWACLHYSLAEVHQAADAASYCSASSYLCLAAEDADSFGVWNMCRVLWPVGALMLGSLIIRFIGQPGFSLSAEIIAAALNFVTTGLLYPCLMCIHEEEIQRKAARQSANAGAERARTLATLHPRTESAQRRSRHA